MAWDSIVIVVTDYRLDSPGIESQWGGGGGARFLHLSTQPPVLWAPGLHPGVKVAKA